jgi:hypothetical protein
VTFSFGAVLAIGKLKARLLVGGGGGDVSGGKEVINPSEGGTAVDDNGVAVINIVEQAKMGWCQAEHALCGGLIVRVRLAVSSPTHVNLI